MSWEFWLGLAVGVVGVGLIGATLFVWWATGIGKR